jgi:hypothetical protein
MIRYFSSLWMLCCFPLLANVSSIGNMAFKTSGDTAEMTLSSTGLGIFTNSPSANLHVNGNAIISESLAIGAASSSSDNLYVSGSVGYSALTSTANVDALLHSITLVDTSAGNIYVDLGYAGNHSGQIFTIKRTSTQNDLWVRGGGNYIDDDVCWSLKDNGSTLSHMKVMSNGLKWSILSAANIGAVAGDNLVSRWKMDQNSGNQLYNSVSRSYDGAMADGTYSWGTGLHDGALTIVEVGSTSGANVAHDSKYSLTSYTVCGWVKFFTPDSFSTIINKGIDGDRTFWIAVKSSGILYFRTNSVGSDVSLIGTVSIIGTDWHFFAATIKDGVRARLYQDEAMVAEDNSIGTVDTGTGVMMIGTQTDTLARAFSGSIEDLRIYNRELTSDELTQIYLAR